jgi:aminopeptidase N
MRRTVLIAPITAEKAVIDTTLADVGKVLNSNVYQKAGFVLSMLRREIGDSAFFRGIRAYYAAYRHQNALTEDVVLAFERSAGRPLGWFFSQWMERPGVADVELSWTYDRASKRVRVNAQQGVRFPPYLISLAVDVTTAQGKTQRVRVTIPANARSTMTVPLALSAPPRAVVFDADVSLLGELRQR